jgi:tetrapyrrole methylase family protein/MazG family protein
VENPSLNRRLPVFAGMIGLIQKLRGRSGCPWDRQQTAKSMSVYFIEEAYELVEAIASGSPQAVCEELGDVLFHLFFIAALFEESGGFSIEDATEQNTEKMIRRHPHVFGDESAKTASDVRKRWHEIKKQEKNHQVKTSTLDGIPTRMPAMLRAYRVSERAARTGFDWKSLHEVMDQAEAEWTEFKDALAEPAGGQTRRESVELEFGDVLFTLTNVARFIRIHPETALADSINKFEKRFRCMEALAAVQGRGIDTLSRSEFDALWAAAKAAERQPQPQT